MKVNAGQAPSTLVPLYIGSQFDSVLTVSDNIDAVKALAAELARLSTTGVTVTSATYDNGILTVKFSDGKSIVIPNLPPSTVTITNGSGSSLNNINTIDFTNATITQVTDGEAKVTISSSAPTIASSFVGIFNTLQELQNAYPTPNTDAQAIIINPTESYYHVVNGAWTAFAPVVDIHAKYVGVFDSVAELNSNIGSAEDGSLAIVGTTTKQFYIKLSGSWIVITNDTIPHIASQIAALQTKTQSIEQDLQTKVSGIVFEDDSNTVTTSINHVSLHGLHINSTSGSSAVLATDDKITVSNGSDPNQNTTLTGEALELIGADLTTRNEGKIIVATYPAGSNSVHVIDKANNEHVAYKLQFPTASIFEGGDEGTWVIDTGLGAAQTGESEIQNITAFEFDVCTVEDITPSGDTTRKVRVTPDLSSVTPKAPPAYLAYFGNPIYIGYSEGTVPEDIKNTVYPEEIVVDSNNTSLVLADKDSQSFTLNKLVGFSESDYLVSVRLTFRHTRWDFAWNQGYIRVSLQGEDGNPIVDVDGIPVIIEHFYSPNDPVSPIQLTCILRVTQATTFQIVTHTNLMEVQPVITPRNEAPSGILIQSLTHLSKTSDAIQQFEQDLGETFPLTYRVFSGDVFDLSYLNAPDRGPFTASAPSALIRSDGQMFHSINGFVWRVEGGVFKMEDNGNVMDGSFAKIYDAVSTQFLRGKTINVSIEYSADLPWRISLLKWTGAPDSANTEIFSSRPQGGQPTWKNGWSLVGDDSNQIECLVTGTGDFSTAYGTLTVPQDAVQFAIILYPKVVADSAEFMMRSTQGSLTQQVEGWYLGNRKVIGEPSSKQINDLITYAQDNQGVAGLSYPITNTESPMPFGKLITWHATVPAPGVNPVTTVAHNQRAGEGGVLFEKEGVLEFSPTQVRIVNEGDPTQTVTFVYKVKHHDGSIETLSDSSTVFTVRGNNGSGQYFLMKSFTYHCRENDVIYLVATASGASGLKLYGLNSAYPMVKGSLVYKKILPDSYDAVVLTPYAFVVAQVDTVDTKYTPASANVVATVPLNTLYTGDAIAAANVTFDNTNDTVKVATSGLMKLDYKAHIIRTQQWNAAVKYALWVERSVDNGVNWTKVDGSVSRINIPADYPATAIPLTVTFPTVVVAGTIFRIRHVTDTIVNGIGLQSYAASGDFPAAASIQLTGTFI